MNSYIKDTTWYKNLTKGFIDTSPPKPSAPEKKNASVTRCSNPFK